MSAKRPNPLWLIVVIALGFCAYGAYTWLQVETPSPKMLAFSVEANTQADIARMKANSPDGKLDIDPAWRDKHKKAVRQEILEMVQHQKDMARSWFVVGIALLVFSLGRIFAQPLFEKYKGGG